jgi:hypothetical protein
MTDLASIRNLVSGVIDALGGDSYESRFDKDSWHISMGSADGMIVFFPDDEDPGDSDILVHFTIMKVPLSKALPFYRRLLEINSRFHGKATLSINDDNEVCLQAGRLAKDLNVSEMFDLINRTASLADRYDDELLDEFGWEHALV